MWKASALAAEFLEAREEPFELGAGEKLGDSCECACRFPAAARANSPAPRRGRQEGTRAGGWLLPPGGSRSSPGLPGAVLQPRSLLRATALLRSEPGLCHRLHPRHGGRGCSASFAFQPGEEEKETQAEKKENPTPTALPACCAHTTNALMLLYPGIPLAPSANTAATRARAKSSGSSRCKTHGSGSTTDCHAFLFAESDFVKAGRATSFWGLVCCRRSSYF